MLPGRIRIRAHHRGDNNSGFDDKPDVILAHIFE